MEFPSNPKRVIAIIEKTTAAIIEDENGKKMIGDSWLETRSFTVDTPILKILAWAAFKKCDGRLIISIDENTEVAVPVKKEEEKKDVVVNETKSEVPIQNAEVIKTESAVENKKDVVATTETPVVPHVPTYDEVLAIANKSYKNLHKVMEH